MGGSEQGGSSAASSSAGETRDGMRVQYRTVTTVEVAMPAGSAGVPLEQMNAAEAMLRDEVARRGLDVGPTTTARAPGFDQPVRIVAQVSEWVTTDPLPTTTARHLVEGREVGVEPHTVIEHHTGGRR